MAKNKLILWVVCVLGLFLMAELTACRASRGLGCPTNLGQVTSPHQMKSFN